MTIRIAALYRFARFDDPAAIRAHLHAAAEAAGIRGTLLVAGEGINGTIAGAPEAIDRMLATIRALPGCAGLQPKFAVAEAMPFHRLKVRLKREIVTMGVADIDPLDEVGTYVAPADWNALIDDPETVVIDTRNDYEVAVGSFVGAVDPETASFRDFPAWVAANRDRLAGRRVAMFCTGGIRCEKATAYLKREGFDDVHHLDGGILRYLEDMPAEDSRWQGECFVFDERVAVGHGLAPGSHALCRACRMPVSAADRASPLHEEGVSCPRCHATRSEEQRAGYAERHRQAQLAAERGQAHVGAVQPGRARDDDPA
ncbi:rhodanese-related sulfurtransferase [Sphingomonas sp. S-NIH.Pt15_0812]|uniref:oxygen-dependent tRNA uridine(34) hydroxylase TrhO n=1 Tax=Sphingomonas sp. S-NIH.Pt15_0812 TaxID=1920129 RepID=UPI000F7E73E2|nr:rhodanese-related sulfurtransferase [Sphingomonas sp. S-NIH.Pt15_0812]RSU54582.1 rhodanese-related sulfurtransferase [Sphingomonas sp. S-NIH.Pt15_0812]